MPRTHPVQFSFTDGEWTPRLEGRVDLAKYYSAAKVMENLIMLPHGGATRRPGTRYAGATKIAGSAARLVPFIYSVDQVYMLEFGNLYLRFWQEGALVEVSPGVPLELTTLYTSAQLPELKFAQSADVLYIVHPDHQPYRLERYSPTVWKWRVIGFNPLPSIEVGYAPFATLTPSHVSGSGRTMTANLAAFEASDVGRELLITAGANISARVLITGYTNQTEVIGTIAESFVNTDPNISPNWRILGSPMTTITPSATGPAGTGITLTLSAAGWRSTDVGRYVHLNGGQLIITGFTNATVVNAVIMGEMENSTAAPSGAWSLEDAAWSAEHGHPAGIVFFEDRLFLAGTYHDPNRLWGSKTGDYHNFGVGVLDDDAVDYPLNSRQNNPIRWLDSARLLLAGSAGEEFKITGSDSGPLTPSNVHATTDTSYGSATVAPLRVANVVLFLQQAGRKLRELTYSFEADAYVAPDLTLRAEHITRGGIVSMAYQQEPDSTVWAVRADGTLLSLTYRRDQDVVGWARHVTRAGDAFEDVAVMPHPDGDRDQVWVIVRRAINGTTVRYVEILDDDAALFGWASLNTDCALTYDGALATTFGGLGHLEGCTVDIVGDGAVYPQQGVVGGTVTISPGAAKVEIGLPYHSTLLTMRPELQIAGTSQGRRKHWSEIMVRLDTTVGVKLNGQQMPFRKSSMPMDQGVPPYTGDRRVTELGWDTDGRIEVKQEQPLPLTLLMITGTLNVEP